MKAKFPLALALSLMCTIPVIVGCGEDEPPVTGIGGDREVKIQAVTQAPNLADIVNDPVWAGVDEASIWVGADTSYGAYFGVGVVRVKGIQDGNNVYLRFNWVDSSETKRPGRWYFGGDTDPIFQVTDTVRGLNGNLLLNQQESKRQLWENEDALALFLDFGNNGSEGADCATTCHFRDDDTAKATHFTTGGGNIDGWIWRAGRTDPFDIAEDYFWGLEQSFDQFSNALYGRNALTGNDETDPRMMHITGRNYRGEQLFTQDTIPFVFVGQNWQPGDFISGYIFNQAFNTGTTSRYDVNAQSEYDPQLSRWTLVLWRTLAAPNPAEDVAFATGQSYEATLAVMRNNLQRHSGSQPFTLKF